MDKQRFEQTLNNINQFGKSNDGLNRLAYSVEEQQVKEYLTTLFEKEGMSVRTDVAGNLIARREGTDPTLPIVACGSHIDTVYNGGEYDGVVGIVAGLEVIRNLNEQNIKTKHSIELIVFACEESARFGVSTIGSKAMAGLIDKKTLLNLKDKDGISLPEAFTSCSLDINEIEKAKRNEGDLRAFYEIHIEQGPVLESKQKDIGIVTGIAAPTRFHIEIEGIAAHSGSTPMNLRKDAFTAAAALAIALENIANLEAENGTVATVGDCVISPGAMNIVPGKTEIKVDIRSISNSSKEKTVQHLSETVQKLEHERGLTIDVTQLSDESPVYMDPEIIDSMERTCKRLGFEYEKMPSGAGHDVMNMASLCPSGLIFIPSKNGLSHNPGEFTSINEIEKGVILLREEILKQACPL